MTFNQHGKAMQAQIEDLLAGLSGSRDLGSRTAAEARDLALAKTHLEDALTRYNSSRYRANGSWKRADPDAKE